MTEGKYLVMWQIYKKIPRNGVLNSLFGKKKVWGEKIVHCYDTEEMAEFGFNNLKSNGCIKPILLKVIRE
ncbi:MAG: hypothetical protein ISS23_01795 [Nanoarchaeota archaeon]|nr:hypothetical protein [Nanoarchaeota archaeon]